MLFLISAIVYGIGAITFLLTAEVDTQDWAKIQTLPVQADEDNKLLQNKSTNGDNAN